MFNSSVIVIIAIMANLEVASFNFTFHNFTITIMEILPFTFTTIAIAVEAITIIGFIVRYFTNTESFSSVKYWELMIEEVAIITKVIATIIIVTVVIKRHLSLYLVTGLFMEAFFIPRYPNFY